MVLVITSIELKSPWKFFKLSTLAMQIMRQLKTSSCIGHKKTGLWTKHYTMTLWRSTDEMKAFSLSGHHLNAMQQVGDLSKGVKTLQLEAGEFLDWKYAKRLLDKEGRVLRSGESNKQFVEL